MEYKYLNVSRSDRTCVVEINRPPVNALNSELCIELSQLFLDLETDDAAGVIIITGAGKAFVAGADISEMENMTVAEAEDFSARGQNAFNAVANLKKPVIAAINGFALGGGCELALACDIRYAAPEARLGQPEVKLGVIPGFGGTQRLPRVVGPGIAKELIYSGRMIKAVEAKDIGLLDRLVETADELLPEAKKLADEIAKNGLSAVYSAKKLINDGLDMPLTAGLALERNEFSELFETLDQLEGMKAFLEKREAKFQS
jgi:enoyl-CoA hydratase